ncbi:uncharacterized protein PRCAT00006364001 [Priceomyces carsonii]|uniref:uncharacterized protein n=1 Tax=Priceomyces carsonii TaxID=28549 RepID=UPI002ED7B707|nr:unnamed protein product [Priceomyces carsonii]
MAFRFEVVLSNGKKKFTAISNLSEAKIFCARNERKWTRIILLLHGFPDNNTSFNEVVPIISNSFKEDNETLLLSPAMRGYEPSSQGKFDEYSSTDLANDVKAWLDSIDPGDIPIHLVGHDWGAIAAFKAASLYPDLISSMVCLAIPYIHNIRIWELLWYVPEQIFLSSYMITMQFASLYRPKLSQTDNSSYLDQLWSYWSPTWNYDRSDIERVRKTLLGPGVIDAATAYYRCIASPLNFSGRRWEVDFEKVPTLLLGGEKDRCMSKKLYELEIKKLHHNKKADVKILSNLGHFLHREDPLKVGELIADWFKKYS